MTSEVLTSRDFLRFYLPLAATSVLLTATNPLLAAALARTADPIAALAGYSVAFALSGVLYSPLLVLQQIAATRLLEGGSCRPVARLAWVGGVILSSIAAVVAFTPLGTIIFSRVVGLSGSVLDEALSAMAFLVPVPLLTGLRSLHQGRLVAGHRTRAIARATGARTGVLGLVAFLLAVVGGGAWIGAAAFTTGLLVETAAVWTSRSEVVPRSLPNGGSGTDRLLRFSTPLMLNVLFWWSTPLIINAVLARTPNPGSALATFAVVEALAWFLASPVGQFQNVSIALVGGVASHRRARSLSLGVALAVTLFAAFLSLPPIRNTLLAVLFDLSPELMADVGRALPLAVAYPLLYGHRQFFQGLFIRAGATAVVGWGAGLRVGVIVVAAAFAAGPLGHYGATLGVGLAVLGLAVEGFYLERFSHSRALPTLEEEPLLAAEAIST